MASMNDRHGMVPGWLKQRRASVGVVSYSRVASIMVRTQGTV